MEIIKTNTKITRLYHFCLLTCCLFLLLILPLGEVLLSFSGIILIVFFIVAIITMIVSIIRTTGNRVVVSGESVVYQGFKSEVIINKCSVSNVVLTKSKGYYTQIYIIPNSVASDIFEIYRVEKQRALGADPSIIRIEYTKENVKILAKYGYQPTLVCDFTELCVYEIDYDELQL